MTSGVDDLLADRAEAADAAETVRLGEDRLELADYLGRLGIAARGPSREALNELHEADVRRFRFDNIDVLLGQHPGVGLAAAQEKFVGRRRGGYRFPPAEAEARYQAEHVTDQPSGSHNPGGA